MSAGAFEVCRDLSRAQAHLALAMDDALGTWHGLSLRELDLLSCLEAASPADVPRRTLAATLGLTQAALLRLCLPMEKTGLVERRDGTIGLRAGGTQRAREALQTAQHAGANVLSRLDAEERSALQQLLAKVHRVAAGAP
jgi:MarR family transcriptional regulator, organic hydroperoxide resistance regulator